jgi:Deacetylase PdaC
MKNTLLFLCFSATVFLACKPNTKQDTNNSTTVANEIKPLVSDNEYYHLQGTIGELPITMDLVKSRFENMAIYSGSYYYDNYQIPITLYGSMEGKLKLTEEDSDRSQNPQEAAFEGDLTKDGFVGTWSNGKKTYNVNLKNSIDNSIIHFTQQVYSDSIKASDKIDARPMSSVMMSLLYPSADVPAATRAFLEPQILKNILGDSILKFTNAKTPAQAFEYFRKDMRNQFDTIKAMIDPKDTSMYFSAVYYYDTNVSVIYNQNQRLTLGYDYSTYSGGAHPMHGSTYENYDLKTLKVLTLKDIFNWPNRFENYLGSSQNKN